MQFHLSARWLTAPLAGAPFNASLVKGGGFCRRQKTEGFPPAPTPQFVLTNFVSIAPACGKGSITPLLVLPPQRFRFAGTPLPATAPLAGAPLRHEKRPRPDGQGRSDLQLHGTTLVVQLLRNRTSLTSGNGDEASCSSQAAREWRAYIGHEGLHHPLSLGMPNLCLAPSRPFTTAYFTTFPPIVNPFPVPAPESTGSGRFAPTFPSLIRPPIVAHFALFSIILPSKHPFYLPKLPYSSPTCPVRKLTFSCFRIIFNMYFCFCTFCTYMRTLTTSIELVSPIAKSGPAFCNGTD